MPTVNPSPFGPKPQFEIAAGTPAVGYKLFFYVAGSTSTKQNTYTDSTGTVANTNPVILDANGFPTTTQLWFTAGQSYKVVYAPSTDTDPPTSPIWTIDNLRGINDTTVTIDQWVAGPTPTYVSATQFTLVGDQTSTFHVGRRIKATVTAGTVYGYISVSAFAALTTVTVVLDSGNLDSGLSAVSYGLVSAVNTSEPLIAGSGITVSFPSGAPTIATRGGLVFLSTTAASASATIDISGNFTSTYDEYLLTITDLVAATNAVELWMRISQAATFRSGAADYTHARVATDSTPATGAAGAATDSKIIMASGISNVAATVLSGEIRIFGPANTANQKRTMSNLSYTSSTPALVVTNGTGVYTGATSGSATVAIDGIRLLLSAGNITSGTFTLYGVKKS